MADEIKNEVEANIDEATSTDESLNTEEQKEVDKRIPYERFKQKVDEANALKEKLAAIEKEQADAKRKELEEQEKYKELYEQAVQQAEQAKQESLNLRKQALLTQAGYSEEQAKVLVKLVEGDDEESIAESIKQIQTAVPTKDNYADPSAFNGEKAKTKTVGADEVGAQLFERIKNKIF